MELLKGIESLDLGLWLKKEKSLILSDFHLGYETLLKEEGVFVPSFQLKEILHQLEKIFKKVCPQKIILNGDLRQGYGKILNPEKKEILKLLDFFLKKDSELILIKGNHDLSLDYLIKKKGLRFKEKILIGKNLILHGDKLKKIEPKVKTIIIGHEHPALVLNKDGKKEKYKCFLKGKFKKRNLLVLPSFNPLLEGTDLLKEKTLSPYLKEISEFEVYVIEKQVYPFGKVKDLLPLF